MTDVLTKEQRQYCMSRIKGKDTKPEMVVRKLVFAMGYRYRLHYKRLPGKPDLVFPGRRKIIFVHGCYWHRHNCKYGRVMPKTRKKFWEDKFVRNKLRDRVNQKKLKKMGWNVLVVWECETKSSEKYERLTQKLASYLNGN